MTLARCSQAGERRRIRPSVTTPRLTTTFAAAVAGNSSSELERLQPVTTFVPVLAGDLPRKQNAGLSTAMRYGARIAARPMTVGCPLDDPLPRRCA
jgi:hypothetical protein